MAPRRASRPIATWCAAAIGLLLTGWLAAAPAAPRIAAAANLNFALDDIARQFTQDTGERVDIVFGASGALTRQILDGAPFELFLAADEAFPDRLSVAGLTRDSGSIYAVGRLVLFAPTGSSLSVDAGLEGLKTVLSSGGRARFAISNPATAPYGRAAEAVLRRRGLWDRVQPRLVLGDTVAQAAQFATTGNAMGGLIAYSLALSPALAGRGTFALVPADNHPPLRQRMVLLKRAGPTAERFYAYVQGPRARDVLERFGFDVPR